MKKQDLRKIYKSKREALSPSERNSIDQSICNTLLLEINFSNIRFVHCFLPANSKNEINTWPIIEAIRKQYPCIQIAVPVSDFSNGTMTSHLLEKETIIQENRWGIPEPVNATVITPTSIDLVLLPLLAVDIQGNRIGYGKGFYDKFLLSCKPNILKIGLSQFPPIDLIEDISDSDIPLNYTISPMQKHNH
jgi:5-formyltetrahydrofolate cyclo-ligase